MIKQVTERSSFHKGILALIILNFIQALMGVFARVFAVELALFQQVAFRMFAALLFSFILFWKNLDFNKLKHITGKEYGLIFVRSILMYITGISFISVAFIYGAFANVAFILALPFTAMIGIVVLREKLTLKSFVLILLSFLGVLMLTIEDFSEVTNFDLGSIFAFIGSGSVAFSNILRKRHSDLLNNSEIGTIVLFLATIMLFVISFAVGDDIREVDWTLHLVWLMLLAGFLNAVLVLVTNYGFNVVKPIIANNILATKAIFGLLIGVLIYQEPLDVRGIIGGVLILSSLFLFNMRSKK